MNIDSLVHAAGLTDWEFGIKALTLLLLYCLGLVAESKGVITAEPLLLNAVKGLDVERPPVWLMRQAGRYMKAGLLPYSCFLGCVLTSFCFCLIGYGLSSLSWLLECLLRSSLLIQLFGSQNVAFHFHAWISCTTWLHMHL